MDSASDAGQKRPAMGDSNSDSRKSKARRVSVDTRSSAAKTRSERVSRPRLSNEHQWSKGRQVYVKLIDNEWKRGVVDKVLESTSIKGVDCEYALRIHVLDEHGEPTIPRTWHTRPVEIPKQYIQEYVRAVDERRESLNGTRDKMYYDATRSLVNTRNTKGNVDSSVGDDRKSSIFEDLLLNDTDGRAWPKVSFCFYAYLLLKSV